MRGKGSDGMRVMFALEGTGEGPIPALRYRFHTTDLRPGVLLVLCCVNDTNMNRLCSGHCLQAGVEQIEYIKRKWNIQIYLLTV